MDFKIGFNHTETCQDGSEMLGYKHHAVFLTPMKGTVEYMERSVDTNVEHGDVIVMSYPKSGTNWVAGIVDLIYRKDELKLNLDVIVPKIDFMGYALDHHHPCVLITHYPPQYFPSDFTERGKGRLIFVLRNPKDAVVSGYLYWSKQNMYKGSFTSFLQLFMIGKGYYGDWFNFVKTRLKFVDEYKDRSLFLIFEDMKREPRAHVRKISDFIGIKITEKDISKILDVLSVDKMKDKLEKSGDRISTIKSYRYRKGEIGDWKNYFTVAMNEKFDEQYKLRMKDIDIGFTFE